MSGLVATFPSQEGLLLTCSSLHGCAQLLDGLLGLASSLSLAWQPRPSVAHWSASIIFPLPCCGAPFQPVVCGSPVPRLLLIATFSPVSLHQDPNLSGHRVSLFRNSQGKGESPPWDIQRQGEFGVAGGLRSRKKSQESLLLHKKTLVCLNQLFEIFLGNYLFFK